MDNDLILRAPTGKRIAILYLNAAITPEQIRRIFAFDGHVLFIVNEKLIPSEIKSKQETPMWLRVLHGLYMGRVYVWNGRYLFGLHFDYDTGDVSESGIIQPNELILIETGTWLQGWPGKYKLARFYDRAWWLDKADERYQDTWTPPEDSPNGRTPSSRQAYEQARDSYWEQQRAREQAHQETFYAHGQTSSGETIWGNKPPPKSAQPDFMTQFARAGSKDAIKTLYKQLAKQYHPDLNPGVDTTEIMQQVNAAYERFK
jgi:hypothetical protein